MSERSCWNAIDVREIAAVSVTTFRHLCEEYSRSPRNRFGESEIRSGGDVGPFIVFVVPEAEGGLSAGAFLAKSGFEFRASATTPRWRECLGRGSAGVDGARRPLEETGSSQTPGNGEILQQHDR